VQLGASSFAAAIPTTTTAGVLEEDAALEAVFHAMDEGGDGRLDARELVKAVRLLLGHTSASTTASRGGGGLPRRSVGVARAGGDEDSSSGDSGSRGGEEESGPARTENAIAEAALGDEEVFLVLQRAFPEVDFGLELGQGFVEGSLHGKRKGSVSAQEFKAWWRSPSEDRGFRSTISEAELKRRLFDRYAATHRKLEHQTGVAFG